MCRVWGLCGAWCGADIECAGSGCLVTHLFASMCQPRPGSQRVNSALRTQRLRAQAASPLTSVLNDSCLFTLQWPPHRKQAHHRGYAHGIMAFNRPQYVRCTRTRTAHAHEKDLCDTVSVTGMKASTTKNAPPGEEMHALQHIGRSMHACTACSYTGKVYRGMAGTVSCSTV